MKQQDDFDQTLRAWFDDDARHDAPRHLFDAVVADTSRRRPRPGWLAILRADDIAMPARIAGLPGRPLVLLAIMATLLLGLIGGALLAGGPARPLVSVPAGYAPRMTPDGVEQDVLRLIAANQLGLTSEPVKVTAILLLPPGTTYPVVWPDGTQGSLTYEKLAWVVEAEGTFADCTATCDTWTIGTYLIDDASGEIQGAAARGPLTRIPTEYFRRYLADHGQAFTPAAVPMTGVVDAKSVVASLQAPGFPGEGAIADPPIYGLVTCVDPARNCLDRGLVRPGQTLAIWWVGFSITVGSHHLLPWATVDAATGDFISGDRMWND